MKICFLSYLCDFLFNIAAKNICNIYISYSGITLPSTISSVKHVIRTISIIRYNMKKSVLVFSALRLTVCTDFCRVRVCFNCFLNLFNHCRSESLTQKPRRWFTGVKTTAGHQSRCSSLDPMENQRMMVRELHVVHVQHVMNIMYDNIIFAILKMSLNLSYSALHSFTNLFLSNFRFGLNSSYQLQSRPDWFHSGSWWQNIQGGRSCICEHSTPQGYAWILYPTWKLVYVCKCLWQTSKTKAVSKTCGTGIGS